MAKGKKKTSRPRKAALSLLGLAEAGVIANSATRLFFGTDAWDWVSSGWFGKSPAGKRGTFSLTLKELIGMGRGEDGTGIYAPSAAGVGQPATISGIVTHNLKTHPEAAFTLIAAPVGFRILRKLMRRPIRLGNQAIRMAGLRGDIRI
jgi:hypothetical protein